MQEDEDEDRERIFSIQKLEMSLIWEVRSLLVVPVGVVFVYIAPTVSVVVLGFSATITILYDGVFSVIVTAVFLRPLSAMMRRSCASTSAGYKKIQKRKWGILIGVGLAVGSSSLLCKLPPLPSLLSSLLIIFASFIIQTSMWCCG